MFEYLKPFSKIIVTGPQRSGTTIGGAMIAHDLGYYFYPEEQIRVRELWRVERLFRRTTDFVLQAPGICRWVHRFAAPDTAIILIRRKIADIIASQERVEWTGERYELHCYGLKKGIISLVKYNYWEQQKKKLATLSRWITKAWRLTPCGYRQRSA